MKQISNSRVNYDFIMLDTGANERVSNDGVVFYTNMYLQITGRCLLVKRSVAFHIVDICIASNLK